jgi:hypothetical protein
VREDKGGAPVDLGRTAVVSSLSAAKLSPLESSRCPCCATINLVEAEYCDCCSSPLDEAAALDRVVQLAAADDIVVNALDNATGLTGDGYLVGPDGAPLLGAGASGGGLSDRELQLAKGVSLRAPPVPFFAATGGASGGATVGAAATPSGATVDDMASVRAPMGSKGGGKRSVPKLQREPSALEVRRGYQAAEAQHLADVRDDKARRAAVQDLAAVEAAQEAAARARGVVAAAACVAAWDIRKAHTVCKAAAALRKRQSAVNRKKTAQGAVAAHAADAAAVKVARAVAAKAAKRARRNGRADVTALAARLQLWAPTEPVELEVPFLVDSGAGATFIDHDTYVKLGSPPYRDSISVSDVSNTVTTAHGIGPLGGYILDASGAWVLPPPTPALPAAGEPHWTVATRPALCGSCSAAQALAPPARQLYAAHGLTSPCAFVGCSLCGLGSTYSVSDFLAAVDAQINWLRAAAAEAALPLGAAPADGSATPAAAAMVGSIDASNAPPWKKRTFSTAECISGSACAVLATAASTAARRAPPAFVVEAMCHPGWAEEGLAVHEDSGLQSWDAFSASTARAHEVAVLGDAALRAGLASRGVRLVSYRESGLLD